MVKCCSTNWDMKANRGPQVLPAYPKDGEFHPGTIVFYYVLHIHRLPRGQSGAKDQPGSYCHGHCPGRESQGLSPRGPECQIGIVLSPLDRCCPNFSHFGGRDLTRYRLIDAALPHWPSTNLVLQVRAFSPAGFSRIAGVSHDIP